MHRPVEPQSKKTKSGESTEGGCTCACSCSSGDKSTNAQAQFLSGFYDPAGKGPKRP